jgi:hypothetical protein
METSQSSQPSPKHKRSPIWIGVILLTLAFGWRVVSGMRSRVTPFADKDRVLAVVPWRLQTEYGDFYGEEEYVWLSNDTVAYLQEHGKNTCHVMTLRVEAGQTHSPQTLSVLNNVDSTVLTTASPDGKQLFIYTLNRKFKPDWIVVSSDGTVLRKAAEQLQGDPMWLAGKMQFLEYRRNVGELHRYELPSLKREKVPLSLKLKTNPLFSPQGSYWVSDMQFNSTPHMELERGVLGGKSSQVNAIPPFGIMSSAGLNSVSPKGEQLLWSQVDREYSWISRIYQHLTGKGIPATYHEQWTVTDADGLQPRTVASYTWSGYLQSHGLPTQLTLKWLPDGKHLSGVYKGALYVVAVP